MLTVLKISNTPKVRPFHFGRHNRPVDWQISLVDGQKVDPTPALQE